jgi:hypothetical protein
MANQKNKAAKINMWKSQVSKTKTGTAPYQLQRYLDFVLGKRPSIEKCD